MSSSINHNPLVSAIIITHNRKCLVDKAIDSVLNQTYPNIELLVVDDASTDGSKAHLTNRAAKDGFTYIYIPENESKGGNYARNLGFRKSGGQFVAYLDDDDEWLPAKTEYQVKYLQKHKECGVAACYRYTEYNFSRRIPGKGENMIEGDVSQLIFTKVPFVLSMAMYRRECLLKAGLFDESLKYWQDNDLNIRVAQITSFGCVHKILCVYRNNESDKSRLTNHLEGWIQAVEYIEQKYSRLIALLPEDLLKKHRLLIGIDGLNRAQKAGDRAKARVFSRMILQNDPRPKDILRAFLPLRCYRCSRDIKNTILDRFGQWKKS